MLAHKPGVLRGPQGQIELFRQYALGNYPRPPGAGGAGSRDAGVARRQDQHQGEAAGELRPRDHGAVHASASATTPSRTSTPPRACSRGWNLRQSDGLPQRRLRRHERLSGVRLQRRPARHRRQDVLVPDLQQRQPDDPGAQRVRRHAGRHRPDHRPGDAPGDGPPAGAQVLELLRQRDSSAGSGLRREHGRRLPAEPAPRSGRSCGYILTSPWFNDPVDAPRALFVAGGVRRAGDQGSGLAELLARQGARRRWPTWARLLYEPPNVGGWPLGAGWFSTGTMLARTNFAATLASSQKELPRRGAAARRRDRRRRCWRRCSIA